MSEKARKALNDDARQMQLVNYATNLAERQLLEGTASSQVITHYLKYGATVEKYRLELEILKQQKELIQAKTEEINASRRDKQIYADAIEAFKQYSGHENEDEYYEE